MNDIALLQLAELYSAAYQDYNLPFETLKGDMIATAIVAPHIDTLSKYLAIQEAAAVADLIIKPVWLRMEIELATTRARRAALAALDFVNSTKPKI